MEDGSALNKAVFLFGQMPTDYEKCLLVLKHLEELCRWRHDKEQADNKK